MILLKRYEDFIHSLNKGVWFIGDTLIVVDSVDKKIELDMIMQRENKKAYVFIYNRNNPNIKMLKGSSYKNAVILCYVSSSDYIFLKGRIK